MPQLFVNHLTTIDSSVLDAERGLYGVSWIVDIELQGELNEQSMVLDFGIIKKRLIDHIENEIDHKLLVPQRSDALTIDATNPDQIDIQAQTRHGHILHRSPLSAITLVDSESINHNSIERFIKDKLSSVLDDNIHALSLHFRDETIDSAYYCYSHGLKKHAGNCQRIAHGHRSKVEIWRNQQRAPQLEQQLAEEWRDIYLGSEDDIQHRDNQKTEFTYQSEQGQFSLSLPSNRTVILPHDSTVECIADFLANKFARQCPGDTIKVRAYEGVNKGACASAHIPV